MNIDYIIYNLDKLSPYILLDLMVKCITKYLMGIVSYYKTKIVIFLR